MDMDTVMQTAAGRPTCRTCGSLIEVTTGICLSDCEGKRYKARAGFQAVEEGGWPEQVSKDVRCDDCGGALLPDSGKCVNCGFGWHEVIGSMPDLPDPDEVEDGYEMLRMVFDRAVEQARDGKGKERHAQEGEAFTDQPIVQEGERMGSNHFQIGQGRKKALESLRLPPERARAELLGAINYLAAAYLLVK